MATTTAQMLSIPEVARRLNISRTSVYDLIKVQKLVVHDVGTGTTTRLRVDEADLDAYIKSTKVAPLRSRGRAA